MRNLKDRIVAITGASRGIGAEIARVFADEGCKLVLCGRDQRALDQVAGDTGLAEGDVVTVTADIRQAEGMKTIVETAYDRFGRVDVFVNNAGVGYMRTLEETTEEEYDATFDTNLKAVFWSFKQLIPKMRQQGGGQIINVSSMVAKQGSAGVAAYAASKAALNTLSDSVANEVRDDNIKITVVAPGSVATDFGGTPLAQKSGRMRLRPRDVADAVVYQAKQEDNAWVSLTELRPLVIKKK